MNYALSTLGRINDLQVFDSYSSIKLFSKILFILYNGQILGIIKISGTPEDEKMCLNWYVLCAVRSNENWDCF